MSYKDEIPDELDRYKHTRRAYRYGFETAVSSGMNWADVKEALAYDAATWIESPIDVVRQWAENSRDTGSARGLHTLNRIEDIAADGVGIPRWCVDGDALMMYAYSTDGVNTMRGALATGEDCNEFVYESIEAFDAGFVDGIVAKIDEFEE